MGGVGVQERHMSLEEVVTRMSFALRPLVPGAVLVV